LYGLYNEFIARGETYLAPKRLVHQDLINPLKRSSSLPVSKMEAYDYDVNGENLRRSAEGIGQDDGGGYASGSIRWYPKGDARNKAIMNRLKNTNKPLWQALRLQAIERSKFPYRDYGTVHLKRNVPGSYSKLRYGDTWQSANADQKKLRNDDGWNGPGMYSNAGYSARGAYWGKALGAKAGRLLGARIGMDDVGAQAGGELGDWASDQFLKKAKRYMGMSGSGDYQGSPGNMFSSSTNGNLRDLSGVHTEVNQLINKNEPSIGVAVHRDETNSITITHTEYIADITPTLGGFQNQFFLAVNPGLSGTFPWLSNIAQFYEEYEFRQLAFTFKSMVTEGNANAAGTIVMCTQYNPTNPAFTSKQTMENYDYANSGKVTCDVHHGIECDPTKHGGSAIEYVRTGAIPTNQDLKTYDLATFQLATNGAYTTSALTLGELWVSYSVVLRKTKIPAIGQSGITTAAFARWSLNNVTVTNLFGSIAPTLTNGNISGFVLSGNTLTFPSFVTSGYYAAVLCFTALTTQPTVTISTNNTGCTVVRPGTSNLGGAATGVFFVNFNIIVANTATSAANIVISGLASLVSAAGDGGYFAIYQVGNINPALLF